MSYQIRSLQLQNFRQFRQLRIGFDEQVTVLTANNGGGKTSILEAIALMHMPFLAKVRNKRVSTTGHLSDIHVFGRGAESMHAHVAEVSLDHMDVEYRSYAGIEGNITGWSCVLRPDLRRDASRLEWRRSGAEFGAALYREYSAYMRSAATEAPVLPVFAYYKTGRDWGADPRPPSDKTKPMESRLAVYDDAMVAGGAFRRSEDSFWRIRMNLRYYSRLDAESTARASAASVVDEVMTHSGAEWSDLEWDAERWTLVATNRQTGLTLPVRQLSDGIRRTIGLVFDIAMRCARLQPMYGRNAIGTVLIDEVDLYLHPEWQQTILGSLRKAFPRIQFIVTTHSPQLLSSVENRCIRVLHADGTVRTPPQQTKGVESPTILATVMGVDPIPPVDEAKWVRDYQALIETERGETEEAQELRAKIVKHFGERHQVVLDCDRLLRWQKFKLRRDAERKEG